MVPCEEKMFEILGNDKISNIERRLCPDMETIKDVLRVKNSYIDKNERVSFSIQAVACDPNLETCASTDDLDEFFNEVYFTTYVLSEKIAFGDSSNIGKRPVQSVDQFHSQFVLNQNEYRDNNNYIVFNKVTTHDDKWALSKQTQYTFLSFKQMPFWTSALYLKDEMISTDGGSTEINTKDNLMLGLYFFVDDYRIEHTR